VTLLNLGSLASRSFAHHVPDDASDRDRRRRALRVWLAIAGEDANRAHCVESLQELFEEPGFVSGRIWNCVRTSKSVRDTRRQRSRQLHHCYDRTSSSKAGCVEQRRFEGISLRSLTLLLTEITKDSVPAESKQTPRCRLAARYLC